MSKEWIFRNEFKGDSLLSSICGLWPVKVRTRRETWVLDARRNVVVLEPDRKRTLAGPRISDRPAFLSVHGRQLFIVLDSGAWLEKVHGRQLFIVLDRGPAWRKIGTGPSIGDRPAFLSEDGMQLFIVLDRGPHRRKIGTGPSIGDSPAFLFVHCMQLFIVLDSGAWLGKDRSWPKHWRLSLHFSLCTVGSYSLS